MDGVCAWGCCELDEAGASGGLDWYGCAIYFGLPAGPVEGGEDEVGAGGGGNLPGLVGGVGLGGNGRFQSTIQACYLPALPANEPLAGDGAGGNGGRQIFGADGGANVARKPFILCQTFGGDVAVVEDEVVGVEVAEAGD